jgi:DNA-binding response OmpR family regulator
MTQYEQSLPAHGYRVLATRNLRQAREALAGAEPAAIVLDVASNDGAGWRWLSELRAEPASARLPVVVVSADRDEAKSIALGADRHLSKPVAMQALLGQLDRLTRWRILIVDDDPAARYALRRVFDGRHHDVLEAESAAEGLRAAGNVKPALIVLDLQLPDGRGEDLLARLRAQEATARTPVAIVSSLEPEEEQRAHLERLGASIHSKRALHEPAFGAALRGMLVRGSRALAG